MLILIFQGIRAQGSFHCTACLLKLLLWTESRGQNLRMQERKNKTSQKKKNLLFHGILSSVTLTTWPVGHFYLMPDGNSHCRDWRKIRSHPTGCQISTFSYYSPLNFLTFSDNKRRGLFSYSSISTALLGDREQLAKEQTHFVQCASLLKYVLC